MSLLIKALHKAQQSNVADKQAARADLSLEPIVPAAALASDGSQQASAGVEQKQLSQQAATVMFAAKQLPPTGLPGRRGVLIAVAGLLLLALAGMRLFSYTDSLQQPGLVTAKAPATAPVPTAQPLAPASVTSPAPASQQPSELSPEPPIAQLASAPAAQAPPSVNTPAAAEKPAQELLLAKAEVEPKPTAAKSVKHTAPKSQQLNFGEPVNAPENASVKVTRNIPANGVNPALLAGYQAFNAGDDAAAQRNYRQVLQSDVHNVDALLGMAAIASRQGRNEDAVGWYGKVLEAEPKNSIAQAALIGLYGQADPVGSESRLKSLIAQQPEAAHLYAALGSIYAEQSQWPAAQQAYFQAHHFAPDNADYAFNLAVSLDQLGKPALALPYYRQALELLPKSGGGIDRAQLEARIAQIQ